MAPKEQRTAFVQELRDRIAQGPEKPPAPIEHQRILEERLFRATKRNSDSGVRRLNMSRTKHSNQYERKVLSNISKYGWHCTSVSGAKGTPSFAYTVGLYHSFGYPELLIIGLPPETAHGILSVAASAAAAGKPFDVDLPTDRLLQGYSAVFVEVPPAEYYNYVLSSLWYYEGNAFPLCQIVWPFEDGTFPWHPSVSPELRQSQPVLGVHAGGT